MATRLLLDKDKYGRLSKMLVSNTVEENMYPWEEQRTSYVGVFLRCLLLCFLVCYLFQMKNAHVYGKGAHFSGPYNFRCLFEDKGLVK